MYIYIYAYTYADLDSVSTMKTVRRRAREPGEGKQPNQCLLPREEHSSTRARILSLDVVSLILAHGTKLP